MKKTKRTKSVTKQSAVLRKLSALEKTLDRRISALERIALTNTKSLPEKPIVPVVSETLGIEHTCQSCTLRRESTKPRELILENYMGPCGDSFCYASCKSSSCRPVRMTVCDECAKKLRQAEVASRAVRLAK